MRERILDLMNDPDEWGPNSNEGENYEASDSEDEYNEAWCKIEKIVAYRYGDISKQRI